MSWQDGPSEPEPARSDLTPDPDPDQAWKALGLVNDWVRHAEAKLGLTVAAAGVTAGVLLNLVKDRHEPGGLLLIFAFLCGLSALLAGVCAMLGLLPRLSVLPKRKKAKASTDEEAEADVVVVNPLYFHDIATKYGDDVPSYQQLFQALTSRPEELVSHIAHQVHANSVVALRKYRWADRAVKALGADAIFLAVVALLVTLDW